jgi:glycosyltransferase involved in cell wall biosynthesis
MKIGIDARIFSSGFTGIGRYTQELIKELIKINDKNSLKHELVLFFNQPEYSKYSPENSNVKKVLVNAKHYSFKEQTVFLKKLKEENCDIVHFPHFNVPIFYRRPYTVTIHDLTLSFFPGRKMTKWFHRLAYNLTINNATKKAKKVIAVSENTKKDIVEHLKISEEKIKTIYNGVSSEFKIVENQQALIRTLEKYKISKDFLLYTGVWRNHKNLKRLIDAFALVKENIDLQLVITGKPDPHYPEVKSAINENNLEGEVILTGLVEEEDLVNLYNSARIYVFPSLYEGFGFPPLEAMRCGTPVAASNSSSIPEVCKEAATYFDPYDIEDIAEKIEALYKDPSLQYDLIEKGVERSKDFSWEKMAHETYETIINAIN